MKNVHFAIPEIYGETLSYYELLRNLVNKTNELIDNYNTVPEQIAEAVANLDASQLFSAVLNQLIHSIATDNTKSANAVKVYKKHDLLYATFNETVNLYESLIDFTAGTETELIVGTNIREVNISELFIELRKLIDINKNNIATVTSVANENSAEITTMHNDITSIENKNTEQDNEISTLRTMISSPYNFKGEVASISALPASGEINDTYYVQDVKYKVTWTGSAWVQSSLSEADYETELSELKSDLIDLESLTDREVDYSNEADIVFIPNKALTENGVVVDYSGRSVTDYIDVSKKPLIYRYGQTAKYNFDKYAEYDSAKNFIRYVNIRTEYEFETINGHANSVKFPISDDAKYVRIENSISSVFYRKIVPTKIKLKIEEQVNTTVERIDSVEDTIYKNKGMTIVNLGDSLFGNSTFLSDFLAQFTGATVYNCACGGTLASHRNDENYDKLSFCGIADAIASGDFTEVVNVVNTIRPSGQSVINIGTVLPSVDFNEVDIITLHYGTNDFGRSIYLGQSEAEDIYRKDRFMCALRYGIEKIWSVYPNIRFVLDTPMWRMDFNSDGSYKNDCDSTPNGINNYLKQYAECVTLVANEYHLPVCDFFNEIGLNKFNWQIFFTPNDGVHPNQNGKKIMAKMLSDVIGKM